MEDAATAITPAAGGEELAEKHRKEVKELRGKLASCQLSWVDFYPLLTLFKPSAKAHALRKGVSKGDKKKKKEVCAYF